MIAVLKETIKKRQEEIKKAQKEKFNDNNNDITIEVVKEEVEKTKDGYTVKRTKSKKNITRLINETAKMLKNETALSKLEELRKAINKGE